MYLRYNSVTMFNRAFVVIVVCIKTSLPYLCLFKSSSVIRRGKKGGGRFPRGIIPQGDTLVDFVPIYKYNAKVSLTRYQKKLNNYRGHFLMHNHDS